MYFSFAFEIVSLKFKKLRRCVIIQQFMINYQQLSVVVVDPHLHDCLEVSFHNLK